MPEEGVSSSPLILDPGKSQIDDVLRLVGDREIDAMITSIGGNDTGFAKILESLVLSDDQICDRLRALAEETCRERWSGLLLPPAFVSAACGQVADRYEAICLAALGPIDIVPKETHASLLRQGLDKLRDKVDDRGEIIKPGRFTLLEGYLADASRLPDLPPGRLYFTEYPNLAETDGGGICPDFLTVTTDDWRWVRDVMTTDLNATIREETTRRGWNFVDGIFADFSGHGYCAANHGTYHPEESLLFQGDASGTAHPTGVGQLRYGERLATALVAAFYPGGDLSRPRHPGYGPSYRRGDCNDDRVQDISDSVNMLAVLFLGVSPPPCLEACNANDDARFDLSDAVYLLNHLFLGGARPALPFPGCGVDPRPGESLGCRASACGG